MFRSDATGLSSSRGAVCCALSNAFRSEFAVVGATGACQPFRVNDQVIKDWIARLQEAVHWRSAVSISRVGHGASQSSGMSSESDLPNVVGSLKSAPQNSHPTKVARANRKAWLEGSNGVARRRGRNRTGWFERGLLRER